MGPRLEQRPSASQGSPRLVFANFTRGVERLLGLEIYSPKEREGCIICRSRLVVKVSGHAH